MKNILRLLASGFVAAFFVHAAHAANFAPGAYSAGTVKGDVSFKAAGAAEYQKLAAGVALPQGAVIKTGAKSTVVIVFGSGSTATVQENSEVEVTKFEQEVFSGPVPVDSEPAVSETVLRVVDGGVTSKVAKLKKGSSYTVNTPVGAAGVRGTVFNVFFNRSTGQFSIATAQGLVVFTNATTSSATPVASGQQFVATIEINDNPNSNAPAILRGETVREIPQEVMQQIETAVGTISNSTPRGNAPAVIAVPVDTTQVGVSPN